MRDSAAIEIAKNWTLANGRTLGHARTLKFPLLDLDLFRIRTFRASVSGSFFTRLGIGGVPFLLPLLYQVGLGFTPIQSGLLIMPQAIAAMSMKTDHAANSETLWIPGRADFQYHHLGAADGCSRPSAWAHRSG